jgi:hypothetical protein
VKPSLAFCPGVVWSATLPPPGAIVAVASPGTLKRLRVKAPVAAPCGSSTIV